jgi:hypothetical protein
MVLAGEVGKDKAAGVGEHSKSVCKHTKPPLKCRRIMFTPYRSVNTSPLLKCKRVLFTPHRSVNTSHLLTKGRSKLNTFPVNSNFPVRHTRELTHGKINESGATCQPYDFPVPSKGQTKAEREFGAGVRSIAIT